MSYESKALREERANVVKQMNDLTAKVAEENRNFSPEEAAKYDNMDAHQEELRNKISDAERIEHADQLKAELDKPVETVNRSVRPQKVATRKDQLLALQGFLLGPDNCRSEHYEAADKLGFNINSRSMPISLLQNAPRHSGDAYKAVEARGSSTAIQSLTNANGGYSVPDSIIGQVEEAILNKNTMRQYASIIRTASGETLKIPTVDDTMEVGQIIAEGSTAVLKSVGFGQVSIPCFNYTSNAVRASKQVLTDSVLNLPAMIGEQLGNRVGRALNSHFTVSASTNYANNPQGLMTVAPASSTAAGTASSASVTYSELLNLMHSVPYDYRKNPGCVWTMSDGTFKVLRNLTDTQGRPLWHVNLEVGAPDTFLGYPVVINQDIVDQALNARFIGFGDMSAYKIRDVASAELVRLNERFALSGEVAWVYFSRHGGKFVNPFSSTSTDAPFKVLVSGSST